MGITQRHLFTSESVTEGHPDKIADQISDAVLDAVLEQDPYGPRGLRSAGDHRNLRGGRRDHHHLLCGCSQSRAPDHSRTSATRTPPIGFDCKTCGVLNAIQGQSPDIAMGVDPGGAGDQGLMFGYACDETPELMPHAHHAGAQAGAAACREVRRAGTLDFPAAGRQNRRSASST